MKKIMFPFAVLSAFIIAALSSCGGQTKGSSDADSLVFDSIVVDTVVTLNGGDDSVRCEIKMNILYAVGANADAVNDSIMNSGILTDMWKAAEKPDSGITMRQAVDRFVASYIAGYREECGKMVNEGLSGASLNYEYIVKTSAAEGRPGVITYLSDIYSFTGGAHGMNLVKAMNFDTATGAKIGKADFFAADADSVVTEGIIKNLSAQYKTDGLDGLKDKGVFALGEPYVPDNFVLGKDSVTFIYQPYDVAAYALGTIRASVPYSDIETAIVKK